MTESYLQGGSLTSAFYIALNYPLIGAAFCSPSLDSLKRQAAQNHGRFYAKVAQHGHQAALNTEPEVQAVDAARP